MSVTRREVCEALAAGTVLLLVQGCGGGGGDATPPRSAGCGAGGADISLNHGHVLVIVSSDLDSMATEQASEVVGTLDGNELARPEFSLVDDGRRHVVIINVKRAPAPANGEAKCNSA